LRLGKYGFELTGLRAEYFCADVDALQWCARVFAGQSEADELLGELLNVFAARIILLVPVLFMSISFWRFGCSSSLATLCLVNFG